MDNETAPTTIEGQIERVTFRNPDSLFMIARFRPRDQAGLITVLGHLPEPVPGELLRLTGDWKNHTRYGQQFEVIGFDLLLPAGVEEIRRYLASGLIPGIGPKTTERLLHHFRGDTLQVIENEPLRLAEVPGIGVNKATHIGQAWREHHKVRSLMAFLQRHGVK
ncbi:MAG: ATP-dependent RecD-like DNA helicase, partial [Desulfatitalea sp.]|nr:ATP-dependent RecD-like DNA helicase [Desulfatitalea sp.]NNJ99242.1 ATP-dependent RecD-like DNA helicase [Desulfatitalea sp.]